MAYEIFMPKLSSTMAVGSITQWYKEEGDSVDMGEAIFEVMTDKIAIEVEAYHSGVLLKKYYGTDEPVPVNQVIGYIGEPGEAVPDQPPGTEGVDTEPAMDSAIETPLAPEQVVEKGEAEGRADAQLEKEEAPVVNWGEPGQPDQEQATPPPPVEPFGKVRATPSARRMAREAGVDLFQVAGSGRKGRVQLEDVRKFTAQQQAVPPEGEPQGTAALAVPQPAIPWPEPRAGVPAETKVIPWKGMRKAIADRMVQSKQQVPHVTLNATFDAGKLVELREQLLSMVEEQSGRRLSYTELVAKALAVALQKHPRLNAHVLEDGIHEFSEVNVGFAVGVEDGLFVPVIRNVERKGLAAITRETKALAEKARQGQLTPDDMNGGTISISNLGNSRVENFNPIIRQPEVAILGMGTLRKEWAMDEDGRLFQKPVMTLSLSFDHRAIDGAPAAAFLDTLIAILENPLLLLI